MKLINVKPKIPSNLLVDRFIVPPFSILDTKQGYWTDRQRKWKSLGIQSELGRGDNITIVDERIANYDNYREQNKYGKSLPTSIDARYGCKVQGTSIFDPVLCELSYKWFSREGDKVIDPFAGGSVRGVVASILGRNYTGVDLSNRQISHNEEQFKEIKAKYNNTFNPINWIVGDSLDYTENHKDEKYNFMLTCPPYYDLEVYSDKEDDLSNMGTYEEFLGAYRKILANCVEMLDNDSFAVVVVGNMRDKKTGGYHDFAGDTIKAMQDAGCLYYNEMILVNVAGTLPIRAPLSFNASRKVGKQHQNVLVFYKGDPKHIKDKFGEIDETN